MKRLVLAAGLTAASTLAMAHPNTGCGLGSIVIEDQSTVVMQVLAATTNGTSGNQTFGITSGTSNCDKPADFVANDKAVDFVENNMDSLAIEIASGKGESLDTLASLLEVEDKAAFASKLQANFDSIFTSEEVTSAQVVESIAAL